MVFFGMRALGFPLVAFSLSASPEMVRRADALCHRTQYVASIKVLHERPAEYHYEMAQLAERQKQFVAAGQYLRSAVSLGQGDVGRLLDLARYLPKHGRTEESNVLFLEAGKLRANEPRVFFARAENYVETRRHSDEARELLRRYIASGRTPGDPSQQAAEKLLHEIAGK